MIRVLVAEDSETARALLVALFHSDPEFQVVGEARNGREAVELTKKLRPDVVTMDLSMPVMDGLEATRRIMVEAPTPIVVVSATLGADDVAASMLAIRVGALTALAKPKAPSAPDFEQVRLRFLATVRALASVKVVGHRLRPPTARKLTPVLGGALGQQRSLIVALAASTGGPSALRSILDALPADFPAPVLLVQHLAPGFLHGFVQWLDATCRLHVQIAQDGERLLPGRVYVAPEDHHLAVTSPGRVATTDSPPVEGFRPSASVLFESLAQSYGATTLAAILTGMGRDGVCGLRRVHASGGRVIAQDESTCSVFGMPGAAIEEGLADFVLPISLVPEKLVELVCEENHR